MTKLFRDRAPSVVAIVERPTAEGSPQQGFTAARPKLAI
jgi:hypothetical protein